MGWEPTNKETIIKYNDIVLVYDKAHSTEYYGQAIVSPGRSRTITFQDGFSIPRRVKYCAVTSRFKIWSYNNGPDILYRDTDGELIWPDKYWPYSSPVHGRVVCRTVSKAWVVAVWRPGINYKDEYKKNY